MDCVDGFDELTTGKLRADAQDIQSTFCTTKGALNGGGGSRTQKMAMITSVY
jgi:hypothetical protein